MTSATNAVVVALALLATSAPGFADSKSEAEELFVEGRRLIKTGKVAAGCTKLEASDKLDPTDGTKLALADCWAKIKRTASAMALFEKIAATTKREDRANEARKRIAELTSELVHLTIEVPTEAELEYLVITRNDQVVDPSSWNKPTAVDPDEYTIVAKAPKYKKWTTTVVVKAKDKTVAIPTLERSKKRPEQAPEVPNQYRNAAIGLAIGGGVAIGIASAIAAHSKSLQNQSDALCPDTSCGDLRGVDFNRRARSEALIANLGWGLGGAAVIAAIVTWRVGAKKSADRAVAITPVVTDDRAGFAVRGRF